MDILLLAILFFFTAKGTIKGFVSTIFAVLGTITVTFLAWTLSDKIVGLFQSNIEIAIKNAINQKISGTFTTMEGLQSAISKFNVFYSVLIKLAGNIYFEGELTAGEILAPSLSVLANRVIGFFVLFILFSIALKILKSLLTKLIKKLGLSFGNHILGAMVGLVEGVIVFGIVFFLLSILANTLLNETLLSFVSSGKISSWLYNNFILKSINLIV